MNYISVIGVALEKKQATERLNKAIQKAQCIFEAAGFDFEMLQPIDLKLYFPFKNLHVELKSSASAFFEDGILLISSFSKYPYCTISYKGFQIVENLSILDAYEYLSKEHQMDLETVYRAYKNALVNIQDTFKTFENF